jgi:hypothetical protein
MSVPLTVLAIMFAFAFGVLVGLYPSTKSVGTGRHRKPVDPRPVLMPSSRDEGQPAEDSREVQRLRLDEDTQPWKPTPEDLEEFSRGLDAAWRSPQSFTALRDHYDNHSTVGEMDKGHWEPVSGSLESDPRPKVLRPEETSSSLLGLSGGTIRPTANLKPVFGETEHLAYDPEDYEEPLICQPCKRSLVKGETFWTVALPEEGEGVFIPICDECEAKSHG